MGSIVPAAYVIPGLVAAMIVANPATVALYLDTNELLGARMAKRLSLVAIVLSPIRSCSPSPRRNPGAFAIPLGRVIRSAASIAWYRIMLVRHYSSSGYLRGTSRTLLRQARPSVLGRQVVVPRLDNTPCWSSRTRNCGHRCGIVIAPPRHHEDAQYGVVEHRPTV